MKISRKCLGSLVVGILFAGSIFFVASYAVVPESQAGDLAGITDLPGQAVGACINQGQQICRDRCNNERDRQQCETKVTEYCNKHGGNPVASNL